MEGKKGKILVACPTRYRYRGGVSPPFGNPIVDVRDDPLPEKGELASQQPWHARIRILCLTVPTKEGEIFSEVSYAILLRSMHGENVGGFACGCADITP